MSQQRPLLLLNNSHLVPNVNTVTTALVLTLQQILF